VNDIQCTSTGCRAWCWGSQCTVQSRCAANVNVLAGSDIVGPIDSWSGWSRCPRGYTPVGLARLDLRDDAGQGSQNTNDLQCNQKGCRAWCWGSTCSVNAQCLETEPELVVPPPIPPADGSIEVLDGTSATGPANTWTAYSRCPAGYTALSVARLDLRDNVGQDAQNVNDIQCNDEGCRAWCWGSSCTIIARCGGNVVATDGASITGSANAWSDYSECPSGHAAVGFARLDLRDNVGQANQNVNDIQCTSTGCRAWCWGSQCTVQSRCAASVFVTQGTDVVGAADSWSAWSRCPAEHTAVGLARLDLRDDVGQGSQNSNDIQCNQHGCRAWCWGSTCSVTAQCLAVTGFPELVIIRNAHSDRRLYAQRDQAHENGVGADNGVTTFEDQTWIIGDAGDGAYTVTNSHSGRRLFAQSNRVHEDGVGAGNGVTVWADQKWYIEATGEGAYVFRNYHSNRRLFAQSDNTWGDGVGASNGVTVFADQTWYIEAA